MIIRINGVPINQTPIIEPFDFDMKRFIPKTKKEANKLKKLSVLLWSVSGSFFMRSKVLASMGDSSSLWVQMQPLWSVFQDLALVLGGIAIFIGMLTFLFKRSLGKQVLIGSALVVGGCFLVPSVLMLIAIIGTLINDALMGMFENLEFKNSVKVGG